MTHLTKKAQDAGTARSVCCLQVLSHLLLQKSKPLFLFVVIFAVIICSSITTQAAFSPALEVDGWGRVMIGKNDPNDNSNGQHQLTLGGGPNGLWVLWGSGHKSFNIGRTFDQAINNSSSYTGGRHIFYVDSSMNIVIERWPGQTNSNYKLDVNGTVRMDNIYIFSDRRYKREIEPLDNVDKLFKLNAVQYKPSGEALQEQLEILKSEGKLSEGDLAIAEASTKSMIEARNSDNTTHYGFIAQELREIYPNLVSEDQHGFLSVNYTELIPVLVDAIKEQQTQIDNLNSQINELQGHDFVKVNTTDFANTARLYQNNPNPFDTQTEIKYYIPSVATNATICVYDMVGAEVLKTEIRGRESGSIVIDANQLRAGMYMYALLVDGKEVDVKRMILTGK